MRIPAFYTFTRNDNTDKNKSILGCVHFLFTSPEETYILKSMTPNLSLYFSEYADNFMQ